MIRARRAAPLLVAFTALIPGSCARSAPPAPLGVWSPLAKQEREADTLFLLDADEEKKWKPGEGGLINVVSPMSPIGEWDGMAVVPGKYRPGFKCLRRERGFVWMPAGGLIAPDEFTVEMWLQSDQPWSQIDSNTVFSVGRSREIAFLFLRADHGRLMLGYRHEQDPSRLIGADLVYDLKKNDLPAGEWENVAFTYKDGTMRLYVNGKPVAEKSGLPPARVVPESGRTDGMKLLGAVNRGAEHFSLSDLRISRTARTPGARVALRAEDTLTIHADQPAGETVRQSLLGGLHTLKGPATEKMAAGVLQVLRTDKLITATPIKVGTPDADHPTMGMSKQYAYDWQVVDRTFDYARRLGVIPYISLDATPQILGGRTPPLKGNLLAERRSFVTPFTAEAPTDIVAFGTIVRDLVYHVVKEKGYRVPYWGVWNEPDTPPFWKGTRDQYFQLYAASARAVRSVDPTLKVGGPEAAGFKPEWFEGLIRFCAEQKVPLDFVSWHYYSGDLSNFTQARNLIDAAAKKYGLSRPVEMIVGEWCWRGSNLPKTGEPPWRNFNYFLNDWHAAFVGASLIEMQRAGVVYSIYTNPVAEADTAGWFASGLMSSTHPWANLNVFRMWAKLKPTVVKTEYDGKPGLATQASRDDAGNLTVLLSSLRYRKEGDRTITVRLPGVPAGARVTAYVVDDRHSNYFDAGPEHAELETVPAELREGAVRMTLRPRSVVLLVIEPALRARTASASG